MKKLFNILLPFALLSFSSVIHAEDDASGIVVSQTISNTPDANGQYAVSIEAYVKGNKTEIDEYVYEKLDEADYGVGNMPDPDEDKLYEYLNFASLTELENYIKADYISKSMTFFVSSTKYTFSKFRKTDLYCSSDEKNYYHVYVSVDESGNYVVFAYATKEDLSDLTKLCNPTMHNTKIKLANMNLTLYKKVKTSTTSWNPMYSTLGTSSTISATFDGFVIPSGATITKQTADCTSYSEESGTATFGSASTIPTVSATRSDDGSTITISGFDFSGNFCGGPAADSKYMGKKLIVTFPVATTVSNTGGSAMTVVNTVTVTNQNSQPVTGLTPSTATLDLPNLTIKASGVNTNDNCIFTVSGTAGSSWNKTFTVMTHGTTPVKLQALPAGTYTITPKSWPWTYNLPDPKNNVTLSGAGRTETFNFTSKAITTPHHGEASASTPAN